MKIVFITSLYRPYSRGGAEVVADGIIHEMKKNHEVHVITLSPWRGLKSLWPQKTVEDGIHVVRFYPCNIFSFISIASHSVIARSIWHLIDVFNIHSYGVVRSYLHAKKPDRVYTHNLKGIGYTVSLAVKHAGVRHIHTLHDIQLAIPSGILYRGEEEEEKKIHNKVHAWCAKKLFGSPEFVVFPSHFLKTFYEERGFFPYSVRIHLRNPIANIIKIPHRNHSTHTDGTIHFFAGGALNRAKGILFLCTVFHELDDPNIHLWIAGAGPDEEAIRNICVRDKRISFLGRLTHDELYQEMSRMHYTVVPSLCYENAPTIFAESCSIGVPTIIADIGGAGEDMEDGVQGFLFRSGDAQSLTQVIRRAIHYPDYQLMCMRAQQLVAGRGCTEYVRNLNFIL